MGLLARVLLYGAGSGDETLLFPEGDAITQFGQTRSQERFQAVEVVLLGGIIGGGLAQLLYVAPNGFRRIAIRLEV